MDVAILGVDRSRWDVWNSRTPTLYGRQGIIITQGGIDALEAPIETEWDESAGAHGATQVGPARYKAAEMLLGICAADERAQRSLLPGQLESELRQAFASERDYWDPDFRHARIQIDTDLSGVREREVVMWETPEPKMDFDPLARKVFLQVYHLKSGEPRWDSGTQMRFFQSGAVSASGFIEVWNPSPLPMRQTWRLTRATWTLPDPSWSGRRGARAPGGEHASRTLVLPPILSTDGGVVITRDTGKHLHAVTFTGANFLVRMQGKWLQFDIPPYTPKTLLPISYTDAPAGGARAELHQPRLWPTPWGGEL